MAGDPATSLLFKVLINKILLRFTVGTIRAWNYHGLTDLSLNEPQGFGSIEAYKALTALYKGRAFILPIFG